MIRRSESLCAVDLPACASAWAWFRDSPTPAVGINGGKRPGFIVRPPVWLPENAACWLGRKRPMLAL